MINSYIFLLLKKILKQQAMYRNDHKFKCAHICCIPQQILTFSLLQTDTRSGPRQHHYKKHLFDVVKTLVLKAGEGNV